MPEAADPIAALVPLLKANGAVAAIAAARVFGGEVPPAEAKSMPRGALVLQPSGGLSLTAGSFVEHDAYRVDLFAYGATAREAEQLLAAAGLVLRRLRRVVSLNVLIHWVQPASGPTSSRDPALAWPRAFQSFQVFHALETVA